MTNRYPVLSSQGLAPLHLAEAFDQYGHKLQVNVAGEQPLTIKIGNQELVTLMTIGSQPELLVLGYLRNQAIFDQLSQIESISVDWDREVADVESKNRYTTSPQSSRTQSPQSKNHLQGIGLKEQNLVDYALAKIAKKPLAQSPLLQSSIYEIIQQVKELNTVYRDAGSVHGCGLCKDGKILSFFEDVGRHGATDALSGKMWLDNTEGGDKVFYTTGRLTSEIVIKSALMGIPVLISRNGATHMAFELAQKLGVTLIARAKSQHFVALNGERLIFDVDLSRKKNKTAS